MRINNQIKKTKVLPVFSALLEPNERSERDTIINIQLRSQLGEQSDKTTEQQHQDREKTPNPQEASQSHPISDEGLIPNIAQNSSEKLATQPIEEDTTEEIYS